MQVTTRSEQWSTSIVRRIAEREGIDTGELSTPLYSAVDPEAVDALFESIPEGNEARLTFEYSEYTVTVYSDGRVRID